MAKAREVTIDPDEPFAAAARRVVSVRAGELFDHAEGVLDTGDIERVHDMRVTTRRLRAALEVFAEAFPKRELQPVLRDVKRLADALGERRDPDVHIAEFSKLRAELAEADHPGVDLLLDSLLDEQARGNARLAAALEAARASDLAGRLHALAQPEPRPEPAPEPEAQPALAPEPAPEPGP
jgi:CHAD domain-containing protein